MFSLPGGLYSLFQDLPVGDFEIYISVTDRQPSSAHLANLFIPLLSLTPSSEVSPTLDWWQFQVSFQRNTVFKGATCTADSFRFSCKWTTVSCVWLPWHSTVPQFLIHSVGGCSHFVQYQLLLVYNRPVMEARTLHSVDCILYQPLHSLLWWMSGSGAFTALLIPFTHLKDWLFSNPFQCLHCSIFYFSLCRH